uniref:Uncharacterized protein n=1 Tax=Myripristis murdjan TaxID=586833 RepID=A0A667ZCZ5_9TELE
AVGVERPALFLQLPHGLLQSEADRLHPVAPAHVHRCAAGSQVHLRQRGQVTVLGHEDVSTRFRGRETLSSLPLACREKALSRLRGMQVRDKGPGTIK